MNYTEMLFNRDEQLVNLLNQADSKNLELIEEINNREKEIERLNNIINEFDKWLESEIQRLEKIQNPKRGVKPYGQEYDNYTLLIGAYDNALDKLRELKGVELTENDKKQVNWLKEEFNVGDDVMFILGLIIGSILGMTLMCCFVVGGDSDEN